MSDVEEPSLREQLLIARARVEKQIDRLIARPFAYSDVGLVGGLLMLFGGGFGPPFRASGVMTNNDELIEKLTKLLHRLDDALEGLGPYD